MQALCIGPALALPPDQVFERAAPGVWALRLLSADNRLHDIGSAVAVAAGKAVTVCTQLPSGGKLVLQREKTSLPATLESTDKARDLCQLDVPGLQAPEAPRGAPRMGQRVYAIGYERGAELAIAEGIVSRLREPGSDRERIQTSVPTSGWLLGAGLYDDEARLLGVTMISPRDAAGVVVAAPARWLAEIAARGSAVAASAAAGPAFALPQPGATWNYAYAYRGLGPSRLNFVVRAVAVEAGVVQESISIPGLAAQQAPIKADALAFRGLPLPRTQTLIELSPYLHSVFAKGEDRLWGRLEGYPRGNAAMPAWTLVAREMGEEQITVPAGTFKATRIDVAGTRSAPAGFLMHMAYESTRFQFKAWYAPEVRRYVKLQHETWALRGDWSGEQTVELLSYSDK
jgi:hypothetical protein